MDRREMIVAMGGATALFAASGMAVAAEGHKHGAAGTNALADASFECVRTAEAGIRHCLEELGKGDKSLAECAAKMNELKIVCAAMGSLSSFESGYAKAMARLTLTACEESEKECRKFEKHKACVECADSCKKCVEECKKLAS